jgi:hypothetical protein
MRRVRILVLASALAVGSLGLFAGPAAADEDSTVSICYSALVSISGDDAVDESDCLEL